MKRLFLVLSLMPNLIGKFENERIKTNIGENKK